MNQRRVILAVVAVGVVAAGLWVWHGSSPESEGTPAPAKVTALVPDNYSPSPAPVAPVSEHAPVALLAPAAQAPGVDQSASSARAAEPPPGVDTPEPADRKFARGGRPDESDRQN